MENVNAVDPAIVSDLDSYRFHFHRLCGRGVVDAFVD